MIGGWLHRREEPAWRRLLLLPLEALYRFAISSRGWLYEAGLLPRARAGIPVISVGNLAVGGAGKTPVVIHLAERLRDGGARVAVLTQGYGGRGKGHRFVSYGAGPLLSAREAGDEAVLIARRCGGVLVLAGPRRARLAEMAEEAGADVAIVDDGFQHLALRRDLDLVVLDGASPFGNGRLLPRGALREPAASLARADLGWISKVDQGGESVEEAAAAVSRWIGRQAIRSRYRPAGMFRGDLSATIPEEAWKGQPVFLLAALARPESFRSTLESLGCVPVGQALFRDHHLFSSRQLREAFDAAARLGARVVCTEKDAVRLPDSVAADPRLMVLRIEVEVVEGEDLLQEALRGLAPSKEAAAWA